MALVSVVMWPLLVPAGFLIRYAIPRVAHARAPEMARGAVIALGLIAAFFMLLVHPDPVSWQSADGTTGGTSSDIITPTEATLSLLLSGAVAVFGGLTMLRTRGQR